MSRVVDQQSDVGVTEIGGDQRFVFLLACGVPQLYAVCTVVDSDVSRQKIYADCGLSICMKYGGRRVEFVADEALDD